MERRKFLLYRRYESLTEILAPPEEEEEDRAISAVLRPSKALSKYFQFKGYSLFGGAIVTSLYFLRLVTS